MSYAFSNVSGLKCLWLQEQHHIMYSFCGSKVTFSKMTNIQGDDIWLLVGSGISFQTASMICLERTVFKSVSHGCIICS